VHGDGSGSDLPGVLKAAGPEAVDAEATEERPAQAFGCGHVEARPAVEQLLLLEQAVADEAVQPRVGPASAHAKAVHHVLGRRCSESPQPTHDLCVLLGLHDASYGDRRDSLRRGVDQRQLETPLPISS
jgi:hypothetical protein